MPLLWPVIYKEWGAKYDADGDIFISLVQVCSFRYKGQKRIFRNGNQSSSFRSVFRLLAFYQFFIFAMCSAHRHYARVITLII